MTLSTIFILFVLLFFRFVLLHFQFKSSRVTEKCQFIIGLTHLVIEAESTPCVVN